MILGEGDSANVVGQRSSLIVGHTRGRRDARLGHVWGLCRSGKDRSTRSLEGDRVLKDPSRWWSRH
jgi:hypothetical protein